MEVPENHNCRRIKYLPILIALMSILLSGCIGSQSDSSDSQGSLKMLVGSYTGESGDDVSLIEIDTESGKFIKRGGIRLGDNPSFLSPGVGNKLVYAVNETDSYGDTASGGVTTMRISSAGSEPEIVDRFAISSLGPCYISADRTGGYLFIAGYGDGSLTVIANDENGIPELETSYLKFSSQSEGKSHPHMVAQPGSSNFLYISDLGQDRIAVYHTFYTKENILLWELTEIPLPGGSGPRHFLTDTLGSTLFVLNELSSDLMVFKRYMTGDYMEIDRVSALPEEFKGENYASDIHLSPDGRFIYVSNRGHNSLVQFRVLPDNKLEYISSVSCEGDWPRNFAISPDGRYLVVANQRSGSLNLFNLDINTGIPEYSGESIEVNSPSCVIFMPYI